jgi:hypothetical protein
MRNTIQAADELKRLHQLEEQAAIIARNHKYNSNNSSTDRTNEQTADETRRQRAYFQTLTETVEAMTAAMRETSNEVGVTSSELLSSISDLE